MRNSRVKTEKDLELNRHDAVENLIELIARLGAILANETLFLRQMKIPEIKAFQKEKEGLVVLLEKAKQQVEEATMKQKSEFTAQEKQELATVSRIFSEIAVENFRELQKAREVNRRVIVCISNAAKDYFSRQRGYNHKGDKGGMGRKLEAVPPFTVNNVI